MRKIIPVILILFFNSTNVKAQCNAAFTTSVNQANAQFHANNTAFNLFHSWRFGDGSFGNGMNVSHTYALPGTYQVMHIVSDSLNTCRDSVLQSITINFPISCSSSFTASRDSFLFARYRFTSTAQVSGGTVQSYNWTVNGVPVSSNQSFVYTFPAGTHTVCLAIATTAGCTSSSCQSITVTGSPSCNLTASFTSTASSSNPRQVSFSPTPSSSQMRYQWNFGDGHTSFLKNPVHLYNSAGAYSVLLTVVDTATNCYDSVRQNLQVHGSPADSCTTSFTYTVNPAQQNQLSFTGISNQTIVSQTWFISGRDTSHHTIYTIANPTHLFPDTGYYNVCLQTLTNTGCRGWYCERISINRVGQRTINLIPSFPNPANGSFVNLQVNMEIAGRIVLTIYTLRGNAIYTISQTGATGLNRVTIPVSTLQPGQYFIDIQYGTERKRSIFQKL